MDLRQTLRENPIIFLSIEREETERLDISRVVTVVNALVKAGKEARGRLVITFSGYDDIPDEVFEIPEIRKYVEKVYDRFPYIFYYLNQVVEGHVHFVLSLPQVSSVHRKLEKPHNEYGMFEPRPRIPVMTQADGRWVDKLLADTRQHGVKQRDAEGGKEMAHTIEMMFPEHKRF
jgi:hypothetical protein